jgi:hypothetical protein
VHICVLAITYTCEYSVTTLSSVEVVQLNPLVLQTAPPSAQPEQSSNSPPTTTTHPATNSTSAPTLLPTSTAATAPTSFSTAPVGPTLGSTALVLHQTRKRHTEAELLKDAWMNLGCWIKIGQDGHTRVVAVPFLTDMGVSQDSSTGRRRSCRLKTQARITYY